MKEYLQHRLIQFLALILPWRAMYWVSNVFSDKNYRVDDEFKQAMKSTVSGARCTVISANLLGNFSGWHGSAAGFSIRG